MGRLVRIPQDNAAGRAGGVFAGNRSDPGPRAAPDNYIERVAKYFPGEVLAFFIFINAILAQVAKVGGDSAAMAGVSVTTIAVGALFVATALVPLFVWYVREEGDAWLTNAAVSTLLFPFWAYALGAIAFNGHWDGNLAAILLASVTIVSGLVAPRAPSPQGKAQEKPAGVVRTERPQLDLVGPT